MITQNDIVVTSWEQLCEEVYHDSWKPLMGRYRSDYAFRGLSDKNYALKNSFLRNCGDLPDLEYHLLRNFRKYSRTFDNQSASGTFWRSLVLAQHHGLPTRLIDWTYSPFIAMHFATANTEKYDIDGVIWKIDFVKVNQLVPPPFSDLLTEEKCNAFTLEMLEKVVSLTDFDCLFDEKQVLFFEPPSLDERIINQFALFSVMTNPTIILDDWLIEHPDLYRRIIIPKELKLEIRDKLDQANITERVLFPGLDGLARWLKRHYQPVV